MKLALKTINKYISEAVLRRKTILGELGGIRTRNQWIKSPLLYH